MSIKHTIYRLNRYVRKHGILKTFWHFVEYADKTFIRNKYIIFYYELTEVNDVLNTLGDHITFETKKSREEISEREYERLSSNTGNEAVKQSVEERFTQGNTTLWLLKYGGEIATIYWSTTKRWARDRFYPYTPRDIFIYDGYTFPEYRGRQYISILLKFAHKRLLEEGFRRIFLHVHELNKASLRGTPKSGMQKFGIARKFRLFGYDVVVWSDMFEGE